MKTSIAETNISKKIKRLDFINIYRY